MKKAFSSATESLPHLRLYLDDIEAVCSLLEEICEDVQLTVDGYILDSPGEMRELSGERSHDVHIEGSNPHVTVGLGSSYGSLSVFGEDLVQSRGIAQGLLEILARGKIWHLELPSGAWMVIASLASGGLLGTALALDYVPLIALGLSLSVLYLAWMLSAAWLTLNRKVTVVFASRKEAPSFLKRNRDKLVLILLSAVVSAGLTLLASYLVTRLGD